MSGGGLSKAAAFFPPRLRSLNLLSNAVKFTSEGGRISISAPEDQPKIFEEFRQVGSDHAHKVEGTGLALTLAKKFGSLAHRVNEWVNFSNK